MISLIILWGLNYLLWFGTWNLIASCILKFSPSTDLRLNQDWVTRTNIEGEREQVPIHTTAQWCIWWPLAIGTCVTIYVSSAHYINLLWHHR